MPEDRRTDRNM